MRLSFPYMSVRVRVSTFIWGSIAATIRYTIECVLQMSNVTDCNSVENHQQICSSFDVNSYDLWYENLPKSSVKITANTRSSSIFCRTASIWAVWSEAYQMHGSYHASGFVLYRMPSFCTLICIERRKNDRKRKIDLGKFTKIGLSSHCRVHSVPFESSVDAHFIYGFDCSDDAMWGFLDAIVEYVSAITIKLHNCSFKSISSNCLFSLFHESHGFTSWYWRWCHHWRRWISWSLRRWYIMIIWYTHNALLMKFGACLKWCHCNFKMFALPGVHILVIIIVNGYLHCGGLRSNDWRRNVCWSWSTHTANFQNSFLLGVLVIGLAYD